MGTGIAQAAESDFFCELNFLPKSEVRPLAPKNIEKKVEPDSDKKVANRQISGRGVQKDHFE